MYKFKKKMTKVVKTVYCETLEIAVTTVSDIINHKDDYANANGELDFMSPKKEGDYWRINYTCIE